MSTALELHGDVLVRHGEARRGIEKAPNNLVGVGRCKPVELSGQLAIQGLGDQGTHDSESHLACDRGRQGIYMNAIHIVGKRVFDQQPMRVPFD